MTSLVLPKTCPTIHTEDSQTFISTKSVQKVKKEHPTKKGIPNIGNTCYM